MIPNDEYLAFSKAPPDKVMDSPRVSSFWRRRAALMLGMYDRNAPWVDIIGAVEYAEYGRDKKFAGELALRHLRIEVERLRQLVAEFVDPDECVYDHHRYCQTHGLHGEPCPHARAKELLAGVSHV